MEQWLYWTFLLTLLCSYLTVTGFGYFLQNVNYFLYFLPNTSIARLSMLYCIIAAVVPFIRTEKNHNSDACHKKCPWKFRFPLLQFPFGRFRINAYGFEEYLSRTLLISSSYGRQSMKCEWFRYETYKSYPSDGPSMPSKLAANGFYYTGNGTYVKCFCCNKVNNIWPESETVSLTHRRISPYCMFANGQPSSNVPIHSDGDKNAGPRYHRFAEREARERTFLNWPNANTMKPQFAEAGFFFTGLDDLCRCFACGGGLKDWSTADDAWIEHARAFPGCLYVRQVKGQEFISMVQRGGDRGNAEAAPARTRNPTYATLEARITSFHKWPATTKKGPQAFADAGLFYTGSGDKCRCFTCDGGLRDWEADDDPWIEHARWFPNCAYVRQVKGKEFIQTLQLAEAAVEAENEKHEEAVIADSNLVQTMMDDINSFAAQAVLSNGYDQSIVMYAIAAFRNINGDKPITTDFIMTHILKTEPNLVTANTDETLTRGTLNALLGSDENQSKAKLQLELDEVKEENERRKHQMLCKVCLDNEVNIVFLPCGHMVTCAACASCIRKCAVCRALIKGTVRVFQA